MSLPVLTMTDAAAHVRVAYGTPDAKKISLYATMRNEMGFLPSFLSHYRSIGYEQFLILDDSSDDGTSDFLRRQTDVVVLHSDLAYGAPMIFEDPQGNRRQERAGIFFKIALPHVFCPGAYVSYFDADEFLFLPPGVQSIAEVITRLETEGAASLVTSLVEFFPSDISGLAGELPQSFTDLLGAYPCFEPEPLVQLVPGAQPKLIGQPKTARLFERYGIEPKIERRGWHRLYMPSRAKKAQSFQKSPRHKTPVVLRSDESYLVGTHKANLPPSSEILLCTAHFVFTAQFADKIARATAWGAHANGASKYKYYRMLLDALAGTKDGFLGDRTTRFHDVQQLVDAGLMRW